MRGGLFELAPLFTSPGPPRQYIVLYWHMSTSRRYMIKVSCSDTRIIHIHDYDTDTCSLHPYTGQQQLLCYLEGQS